MTPLLPGYREIQNSLFLNDETVQTILGDWKMSIPGWTGLKTAYFCLQLHKDLATESKQMDQIYQWHSVIQWYIILESHQDTCLILTFWLSCEWRMVIWYILSHFPPILSRVRFLKDCYFCWLYTDHTLGSGSSIMLFAIKVCEIHTAFTTVIISGFHLSYWFCESSYVGLRKISL